MMRRYFLGKSCSSVTVCSLCKLYSCNLIISHDRILVLIVPVPRLLLVGGSSSVHLVTTLLVILFWKSFFFF